MKINKQSYVQELKALEVGEDPNHCLAMVVFKEGVAREVSILTLNIYCFFFQLYKV